MNTNTEWPVVGRVPTDERPTRRMRAITPSQFAGEPLEVTAPVEFEDLDLTWHAGRRTYERRRPLSLREAEAADLRTGLLIVLVVGLLACGVLVQLWSWS